MCYWIAKQQIPLLLHVAPKSCTVLGCGTHWTSGYVNHQRQNFEPRATGIELGCCIDWTRIVRDMSMPCSLALPPTDSFVAPPTVFDVNCEGNKERTVEFWECDLFARNSCNKISNFLSIRLPSNEFYKLWRLLLQEIQPGLKTDG